MQDARKRQTHQQSCLTAVINSQYEILGINKQKKKLISPLFSDQPLFHSDFCSLPSILTQMQRSYIRKHRFQSHLTAYVHYRTTFYAFLVIMSTLAVNCKHNPNGGLSQTFTHERRETLSDKTRSPPALKQARDTRYPTSLTILEQHSTAIRTVLRAHAHARSHVLCVSFHFISRPFTSRIDRSLYQQARHFINGPFTSSAGPSLYQKARHFINGPFTSSAGPSFYQHVLHFNNRQFTSSAGPSLGPSLYQQALHFTNRPFTSSAGPSLYRQAFLHKRLIFALSRPNHKGCVV